jgi:DNA-binding FadR family transcriptional regulator
MGARLMIGLPELTAHQSAIYAVVQQITASGEQWPGDRVVAELAGIPVTNSSNALDALRTKGYVHVQRDGRYRVIVTDRQTGMASRAPDDFVQPDDIEKYRSQFSGPCWRCGSRGACAHRSYA